MTYKLYDVVTVFFLRKQYANFFLYAPVILNVLSPQCEATKSVK